MINAALKLFAINGYKHASTDDIVKEAGISKGLLFHYFTNKMGLYSFLIDYSAKYMSFEFSRTIGEEKDYFDYLEKLETAKLNVLRNYPYMSKFIEGCMKENGVELDETGTGTDYRLFTNDTAIDYTSQIIKFRVTAEQYVCQPYNGVEPVNRCNETCNTCANAHLWSLQV